MGRTAVPLDVISSIAGDLVKPDEFDLPGLLFIDTPGHHSFTTLRARGGALADIAILVVDVNDGFQPQTIEALDILQRTETPFIVAANKIDTVAGWNPTDDSPIMPSYESQSDRVQRRLDEQLYEIIGELSDADFTGDLYWQVRDFQQTVGVVPVSAMTGEGVPDLLAVLMGLSQRYMREAMEIDVTGPGIGTVLEVKDEKGFGTTIDTVLYDGTIRTDDTIVVGGTNDPIVTEVRALLTPRPLAEIRTESRFEQVESVSAASGIKIAAPDLEEAMAGAPVRVVRDDTIEATIEEVEAELADIAVETSEEGVVVKADTLGSLEALADALSEAEIGIVRAEVGAVAPRDVAVASTAEDERERVILGFNVEVLPDASERADIDDVRLFMDDVNLPARRGIHRVRRRPRPRPAGYRPRADHPARAVSHFARSRLRQSDPAGVVWRWRPGRCRTTRRSSTGDGANRHGLARSRASRRRARTSIKPEPVIGSPSRSMGRLVGRQIDEGDQLWTELPEKHAKIPEQELSRGDSR
ncbi:MAG: translation initiation factor IF-2 [Natrialbaceae archaeon]|nr:translation initiation factor IF-2 [Natrialbaceae archaeon]